MAETPKSTFRFDDETRRAIADLLVMKYGRDRTEAVARAIREMRDIVVGGGEIPSTGVAEKISVSSGQVLHLQTGAFPEVTAEFPFHPRCHHCGESFGAFNRFASMCGECKKSRHIGDPRDCSECTAGQSI